MTLRQAQGERPASSLPSATLADMQAWARGIMVREPDFVIGDDYLRRWYVVPRNPFCNVYLHHILHSDDDRALHDQPTETPVVVNPSPVADQVGTIMRDLALILAALPALLAVLGTRDVKQIVGFLSSTEFAPVLGVLVTGGVLLWRQLIARRAKAELVTVATAAPDSVAVIKGEEPISAADLASALKQERE